MYRLTNMHGEIVSSGDLDVIYEWLVDNTKVVMNRYGDLVKVEDFTSDILKEFVELMSDNEEVRIGWMVNLDDTTTTLPVFIEKWK